MDQVLLLKKLVAAVILMLKTYIDKIVQQEVRDLVQISHVYYSLIFPKNKWKVVILVLINFESKLNVIKPTYAAKLGRRMQKTNVNSNNIDNSALKTYHIIIATFYIFDKLVCLQFW